MIHKSNRAIHDAPKWYRARQGETGHQQDAENEEGEPPEKREAETNP
jgi:hypothetical protein